jgi:exopolyphosphatase/guanosine-5'-triphosphate,3'-diphosphate pyrophosphatase
VVDIGSNSVRLVVFDGAARSPAYFFNEKVMCALGAGLAETGALNPDGRLRALSALRRFCTIAKGIGLPTLTAVATAAVREANDGADFIAQVQKETGLKIHVIDGSEEARLAAQGVLLGWPGSYGLVCDIGGGSMELAEISNGQVGQRVTSPLGPLKLINVPGGKKGRGAVIAETLDRLREQMGPQPDRLFLVGGSWRALARIDMHRRGYPLHVMHEYQMTARDVKATVRYIEDCDLKELGKTIRVTQSRMALVPIAAEILKGLLKRLSRMTSLSQAMEFEKGFCMNRCLKPCATATLCLKAAISLSARMRGCRASVCGFTNSSRRSFPKYPRVARAWSEPLVCCMM